jgi:hypothetical protein
MPNNIGYLQTTSTIPMSQYYSHGNQWGNIVPTYTSGTWCGINISATNLAYYPTPQYMFTEEELEKLIDVCRSNNLALLNIHSDNLGIRKLCEKVMRRIVEEKQEQERLKKEKEGI